MYRAIGVFCCGLFLLASACEKELTDPGDRPPEDETFQDFVEHFAREYAERDSAGYGAYLDSSYLFELLPDAIEDLPNPWWDVEEELEIAGRMFGGRYGEGGIVVLDIDLDLQLKGTPVVDYGTYEGRPAGETWYRATTYVDLKVIVTDPQSTDGTGIIRYEVKSDQVFVLRRDPGGSGRYLICRQIDQESVQDGRPRRTLGTKESSWGGVKNLFR